MQLTGVCYTTFTAIAKANMEVHTAWSAKGKRRPYQHYSATASPRFGPKIARTLLAPWHGCSNVLLLFQGAESLGQRDYSVFGQKGLCWRMRKDIENLHSANCSTLYSAVFNNVYSYISWGLNFVCSPGHKICPGKI